MTGMQVIENGKIVDSSSIVPVRTVSDVTASRSLGVTYYNTTDKTMTVNVSVDHDTPANLDRAQCQGVVGGVYTARTGIGDGIAGLRIRSQITLVVPPGDFYNVETTLFGTGTNSLLAWIESY